MYFFYNLLLPLVYLCLQFLSLFSKKIKKNLEIRKEPHVFTQLNSSNKVFWFHSSSVGEYEQARVVANSLKKLCRTQNQKITLVFSVYSYSAFSQRKDDTLADEFFTLPFDFKSEIEQLINKIQPTAICYARYDVWPNMARIANQHDIPQYLLSASLPETSSRNKGIMKYITRNVYKYLTNIFTINDYHRDRFLALGLNAITLGDSRFDAIEEKVIYKDKIVHRRMSLFSNKKKILIAGSSYATSEKFIIEFLANHTDLQCILAPHHVDTAHIEEIKELLQKANLSFSLYSEQQHKLCRVLIVNTTGVLAQLYRYASIAYVGGGFEGSIHSVNEPCYFGLPVIAGPAIKNSQEAIDMQASGGLSVMKSATAINFKETFNSVYENINNINHSNLEFFRSQTGSALKMAQAILPQ